MWKKDENGPGQTEAATATVTPSPRGQAATAERATIGRSIAIKGEVSGDEDLLIQGQVDGSVDLGLHAVTVGSEGRVKANINGRIVTVEGEVEGDLKAQEQVILRSSARVQGDITAPRVVLEDGASFRGLVDMAAPGGGASKPAATLSGSRDESKDGSKDEKGASKQPAASSGSSSAPSGEFTDGGKSGRTEKAAR